MNLEEIKKTIGFSLVGEYLRGANRKVFPKTVDSKSIGVAVLGESYSFEKSLINERDMNSPALSCGTLSSLIDTVKTQIDDVYTMAEGVYPFDNDKREKYVINFAKKLLSNSLPIAYGEGADDDELKQDISILLRQSKEEFEKRVEDNEKAKEEEKEQVLTDNPTGEEMTEDSEGMEGEEGGEMMDGDSVDDEIPTNFGPDDEESEDDGWKEEPEEGEESEGEEEQSSEADEFFENNDDGEESEDDDEEDTGQGESVGLTRKQARLLSEYNASKGYSEEKKFYISGVFSSIPYGTLKGMCEKLLEKENENFKAIGESFDFKDIRPNTRLHKAHSDYIESIASIMVLQNRLNIPVE